MKKFFLALMAVLVLASCGGDKKDAAKATENTETAAKQNVTPSDVIKMTVDLLSNAATNLEKATTADEVIDQMAVLYSGMKDVQTKYGEVMLAVDTLSEEELIEKYPAEFQAMEDATIKYTEAMMGKYDLMENMTPEQEARLMELMEAEL